MIKKLSQRIFFLIMISLGTIVLGIIMLFAFLNYRNTINTAGMMMDRFMDGETRKNANGRPMDNNIIPDIEIEGLYYFLIENSKIIENSDTSNDQTIEEYAIKAYEKNNESGIIGKYIYKTREIRPNTISVMLMENEEAILHARRIIIISITASILALIIIYIIAKKYQSL